jgi:hypothetical protein
VPDKKKSGAGILYKSELKSGNRGRLYLIPGLSVQLTIRSMDEMRNMEMTESAGFNLLHRWEMSLIKS